MTIQPRCPALAVLLLLGLLQGCPTTPAPATPSEGLSAEPVPAPAAPAFSHPSAEERPGVVRRGDRPLTLLGPALAVGQPAPSGTLRGHGFEEVPVDLADGTVRVVLLVPSLDTPTCSLEARTFNERAAGLGEGVEILVVSRDLPPAQERFCAAEGIERVRALSDYIDGGFGRSWGLLIKETGLLARAVAVVDAQGIVRALQIVENIPDEPDYDAALAAVTALAPARQRLPQ